MNKEQELLKETNEQVNGLWEDCWNCGGSGYVGHECGEDTCCCRFPEDNIICDVCNGRGGYYE